MMRVLISILLTYLMISCQHQQGLKNHLSKQAYPDSIYLLSSLAKRFSLTNVGILGDSNQLTFYYKKRFDTSLIISFKKQCDGIRAVVYQVPPPYYRNGGSSEENQNDLQFFEGFSFSVDSTSWESTVRDAAKILNTGPYENVENAAFDGATYLLAFNSQIRINGNAKDDSLLSGYLNLLKSRFLYKCMEQKPVWRRKL